MSGRLPKKSNNLRASLLHTTSRKKSNLSSYLAHISQELALIQSQNKLSLLKSQNKRNVSRLTLLRHSRRLSQTVPDLANTSKLLSLSLRLILSLARWEAMHSSCSFSTLLPSWAVKVPILKRFRTSSLDLSLLRKFSTWKYHLIEDATWLASIISDQLPNSWQFQFLTRWHAKLIQQNLYNSFNKWRVKIRVEQMQTQQTNQEF